MDGTTIELCLKAVIVNGKSMAWDAASNLLAFINEEKYMETRLTARVLRRRLANLKYS